jgi:hypothetical protein
VYSKPLPEQHASGVPGSLSGPTHVHSPPLHMPEMHAAPSVQAAPFVSVAVAHAPESQKPDWHSPSLVQALPFGCVPHVPSTHVVLRHSGAFEQGWPSGRPHPPW